MINNGKILKNGPKSQYTMALEQESLVAIELLKSMHNKFGK